MEHTYNIDIIDIIDISMFETNKNGVYRHKSYL